MSQHPVASAVMIVDKSKKLLLLKRHPGSEWMPNKWGLPGGIVEEGEHWADAAIRETREETKLAIKDLRLLEINDRVVIYVTHSHEGNVEIDFEHTDWMWAPREDISKYDLVPNIKELYETAMMYEPKRK